jgi:hypothetical protein
MEGSGAVAMPQGFPYTRTYTCAPKLSSQLNAFPVFCAVATHTPSQGDFCVTASHRFCGTVIAETRR